MMSDRLQEAHWALALIQSLPEGLITIDGSGHILFFNRGAERITGWSASDVLGISIEQVLRPSSGLGSFQDYLPRVAAMPPFAARTRQGQDVMLAITASCLDRLEGSPPETVLVIRDVTAEDAAARLRSYFLANISHEFRTPLSALKASVELLLEGVNTFTQEETLQLVRSIHFSVTSLQTLVDNLLESVSIEAGRFHIRPHPTDLNSLVGEAAAIMKPLLERRSQTLLTRLPEHLPKLSVDPVRLTQVLVNLLSNASKYGPADEPIELAVEYARADSLKISVSDRGSGIRAEDRENIFRRFVRLDEKDNPQYGIGLGLSVVKTIVESHGGSVGLEERAGGGSVFYFTILLEDDQA